MKIKLHINILNNILIATALFLLPLLLFSQENKRKPLGKSFSVSGETMLYQTIGYHNHLFIFTNFEYLLDTKNKTSLILGLGKNFWINNWNYSDMAVKG